MAKVCIVCSPDVKLALESDRVCVRCTDDLHNYAERKLLGARDAAANYFRAYKEQESSYNRLTHAMTILGLHQPGFVAEPLDLL